MGDISDNFPQLNMIENNIKYEILNDDSNVMEY